MTRVRGGAKRQDGRCWSDRCSRLQTCIAWRGYCSTVEAFGRELKVDTVIEQLVWAHSDGPAEARTLETEYFVRNCGRIQNEAREKMKLLKLLPVDVYHELLEAFMQALQILLD